jgi:hypothetical protein
MNKETKRLECAKKERNKSWGYCRYLERKEERQGAGDWEKGEGDN